MATIEEIKIKYDINSDDLLTIRKELLAMICEIHRSSNGAKKVSEEVHLKLCELNNAVDDLDKLTEKGDQSELIKPPTNLTVNNRGTAISLECELRKKEVLSTDVKNEMSVIGVRYKRQRTTSAALAAIIAIIGYPMTILNPISGAFSDITNLASIGYLVSTMIFLLTTYVFIIFISRYLQAVKLEEMDIQILDTLKSENYQNRVFYTFCQEYEGEKHIFSKDNLVIFIQSHIILDIDRGNYHNKSKLARIYGIPSLHNRDTFQITDSVADSVADVLIERAQRKHAIKPFEEGVSLIDYYEIADNFYVNKNY